MLEAKISQRSQFFFNVVNCMRIAFQANRNVATTRRTPLNTPISYNFAAMRVGKPAYCIPEGKFVRTFLNIHPKLSFSYGHLHLLVIRLMSFWRVGRRTSPLSRWGPYQAAKSCENLGSYRDETLAGFHPSNTNGEACG